MNTEVPLASTQSSAIRWQQHSLALLDQRLLPQQTRWLTMDDAKATAQAIKDMVVRGAPAIGIAAAYGVALEARLLGDQASLATLQPALQILAASRPTAVNLFWALQRLEKAAKGLHGQTLIDEMEQQALAIHQQDLQANLKMGALGASLFSTPVNLYTHCNTGALATGGHGTALGIIRSLWQRQQLLQVYAGETRPWMQGARLTSWELRNEQIPVTLVADSAAGLLMQQGKIDAVIVGADRITANGDTANKVGTYNLAVLARHHGLPFIVAAPISTLDPSLPDGQHIVIEERDGDEIRQIQGQPLAPSDCPVYNPAFDITPAALISAIVTERGIIRQPDSAAIAAHLAGDSHD